MDSVKYLGVTLDSKLNFKAHIKNKCKKATCLMSGIRLAIGQLLGPKPAVMRWAYQVLGRPRILYGAVVWAHRAASLSDTLRRLQREAMLSMGHFIKSTPTRGMEIVMNFTPLHILAQEMATLAGIRIRGRNKVRWEVLGSVTNG